MSEYAEIISEKVISVIVCESDPVSFVGKTGTWVPITGGAGVDWSYSDGLFISPPVPSLDLVAPEALYLAVTVATDEGSPTWTYQWKKDSVDISGETSDELVIDPTTASTDDGTYTCEVSDGTNTLTTVGVTLTVTA